MERLIIICAIALLAAFAFTGCVSQGEIRAEVWLNSGLPSELCTRYPEIKKYGSYRRLNDSECLKRKLHPGCVEFMSYCQSQYQKWVSMSGARFEELLKAYLPAEGAQVSSAQENP